MTNILPWNYMFLPKNYTQVFTKKLQVFNVIGTTLNNGFDSDFEINHHFLNTVQPEFAGRPEQCNFWGLRQNLDCADRRGAYWVILGKFRSNSSWYIKIALRIFPPTNGFGSVLSRAHLLIKRWDNGTKSEKTPDIVPINLWGKSNCNNSGSRHWGRAIFSYNQW